jgi:murein DD-endopeptidase MepM/ murein hydrolase activator NlpD
MPRAQAASADPPFEIRFPQDPIATDFVDNFGAPRPGGRRHEGVDLNAAKLTEVYAFADGVVASITVGRSSGRHIAIEHAAGWETHYMHLNNDDPDTDDGEAAWDLTVAPGVEVGSRVVAGQLIAWVGDSGNAEDGAHTHFELHIDGRVVNPYPYLAEAYRQDLMPKLLRENLVRVLSLGDLQIV